MSHTHSCSFCEKENQQMMIQSNVNENSFICIDCVRECNGVIARNILQPNLNQIKEKVNEESY